MYAISRSVAFSLLLLLCALSASPQTGEAPAKDDNLYSMALLASMTEMEKSWGHIDDSNGGSGIRTDYHHMLVEKDPEITDNLPSEFGDYRVEYLDRQAQIDRYKKLRKQFSILRIHPMKNEGSRLKISVTVSYLEYKNGRLMFALSDWSNVEFRYDCGKQNFVIAEVKLGGI